MRKIGIITIFISLLWLTGCGAPASSTYEPATNLSETAVSSAASTPVIPADSSTASTPAASLTTAKTPAASPEKTTEGPYKQAVIQADYIVTGTLSKLEYVVKEKGPFHSGPFLYTIYTLEVEKVIKGEAGIKTLLVETEGGIKDNHTWWIEHQEVYEIPTKILIGLTKNNDNATYNVLGVYWLKSKHFSSSPDLENVLSLIIVDMKANNIPITLPHEDYPPLPTSTTYPYSKK